MNPKPKKRPKTYPFSIVGVYASTIFATISIIFSLLLLWQQAILLLCYAASTSLMTLILLELKIRYLCDRSKANGNLPEGQVGAMGWRILVLLFFLLLASIFLPIFLSKILDYRIWFMLLISFISAISISEITFYAYTIKLDKRTESAGVEEPRIESV